MATNAQDLAAQLAAAAGKADNIAAESAAPAAQPSETFVEKSPSRAKKSDAEREATENIRTNVTVKLAEQRHAAVPASKRNLLEAVSKHAYIAGYIVNNDERTDFYSKKDKDTNAFHIGLRMSSPTAPQGVVIMLPLELMAYFEGNQWAVPENQTKITALKNKPFGDPAIAYRMEIVPYAEVIKFVMDYTNGLLKEHPDIVSEYVRGGKNVTRFNARNDASGLTIVTRGAFDKTSLNEPKVKIVAKHTYRSKIVTPGNYIAKARYVTFKPSAAYSAEEAGGLNKAYLGKFTKNSKTRVPAADYTEQNKHMELKDGPIPLTVMDPESAKNIVASSDGTAIKSSAFFPTQGNPSWFADAANTVPHWYQKNADGTAVQVSASQIVLPLKKEETNSKGNVSVKTQRELLGGKESASSYKLDDANFGTILKITNGLLTVQSIAELSSHKFRTTKDGTKVTKGSATISGADLAGMNLEDALRTLNSGGM